MKMFYRMVVKSCPTLALAFSLVVTATTMYINQGISLLMIFVSIQVYLNWYCICAISKNASTMRSVEKTVKSVAIPINDETNSRNNSTSTITGTYKYWYCDRCCYYTYRPTQHCGPCHKCYHHRDHHCIFVGSCVLRQNMGNFIIICYYTSVACLCSLITVGPHLYDDLKTETGTVSTILNFCFPVALARFVVAGEHANLLMVTLFDTVFSVCCMCFIYGTWKFYLCVSGKQRYYPHVARKQDLKEIFGSYGLTNFIFPYNGFLGTRDIDGKYEMKEI